MNSEAVNLSTEAPAAVAALATKSAMASVLPVPLQWITAILLINNYSFYNFMVHRQAATVSRLIGVPL